MDVKFGFLGLAIGATAIGLVVGGVPACTTDPDDPGANAGMGGSPGGTGSTLGAAGTSGGGGVGGPAGTKCASPISIAANKPGIADFDGWDGASDIGKWSAPFNNDSSTGLLAGPFGYGDRATGFPETFDMVMGQSSKYAVRIKDTLAQNYGGGLGTWWSSCVNATAFQGLSFWVRGSLPTGMSTLTLSMQETLPSTPAKDGDPIGTCAGTGMECAHPTFSFPVTDTWTKIQVPWGSFTAGVAPGAPVMPNGRNIFQIQFGVGLVWGPAANPTDPFVPTPAPYELAIDTIAFY